MSNTIRASIHYECTNESKVSSFHENHIQYLENKLNLSLLTRQEAATLAGLLYHVDAVYDDYILDNLENHIKLNGLGYDFIFDCVEEKTISEDEINPKNNFIRITFKGFRNLNN